MSGKQLCFVSFAYQVLLAPSVDLDELHKLAVLVPALLTSQLPVPYLYCTQCRDVLDLYFSHSKIFLLGGFALCRTVALA